MTPGLVVFDAESPAVEQQGQIGELRKLVIGDPVRVENPVILALAGRLRLSGLLPEFIVYRIGFAPSQRVVVVVPIFTGRTISAFWGLQLR